MADEEEEVFEAPPPSKLPVILGVVAAAILGGAGVAFLMGGTGDAAGEGLIGAAGAAEEGAPGPGALGGNERIVFSLETFNVNLRGAGGGRVLRMEVQIEIRQKDEQHIQRAVPRLRDGVLTLASDYTFADLEGLDGKTRLRDELHGRLNKLLDYGRIERVYFTEFVVQ
jgi:flagellar FliL protein